MSRRGFLWVCGSSAVAAGLVGCGGGDSPVAPPAPTGDVRGTVTDLQGAAQGIGRIYLLLDTGLNQGYYVDVAPAGTFDMGQIPTGNYQLRFWGGSMADVPEPKPNPVRITVTEGQTTVVAFQIEMGTPDDGGQDIFAGDYFFQEQPYGQPNAMVTVKQGTLVCWYNVGLMDHTVSGGPWGDSGTISRDGNFMWLASETGTFPYRCNFHNPQMQATLQVV